MKNALMKCNPVLLGWDHLLEYTFLVFHLKTYLDYIETFIILIFYFAEQKTDEIVQKKLTFT